MMTISIPWPILVGTGIVALATIIGILEQRRDNLNNDRSKYGVFGVWLAIGLFFGVVFAVAVTTIARRHQQTQQNYDTRIANELKSLDELPQDWQLLLSLCEQESSTSLTFKIVAEFAKTNHSQLTRSQYRFIVNHRSFSRFRNQDLRKYVLPHILPSVDVADLFGEEEPIQ